MHYIVYKTVLKETGQFYIGSHKTNNLNDGYLGSGGMLKKLLRKYGRESFEREVLAEAASIEEMHKLETEYIQKYIEDAGNINLAPQACGGLFAALSSKLQEIGSYDAERYDEIVQNRTEALQAFWASEKSKEARDKLSSLMITYCKNPEIRQKKSEEHVKFWNEIKSDPDRYDSIRKSMSEGRARKQKERNGAKWKSEETEKKAKRAKSDSTKAKLREARMRANEAIVAAVRKQVQCVETGDIFESVTDAARAYNIGISGISSVLHGKQKTTKGLHWVFYNDD